MAHKKRDNSTKQQPYTAYCNDKNCGKLRHCIFIKDGFYCEYHAKTKDSR